MTIRAIIFDLGGVLLDWDPRYVYRSSFRTPQELEAFLEEIGFADWNAQQDRGRPFAEGVEVHSERFPQYAELIRLYQERWADSVAGPIHGTLEIARALKARGYPLYALSNWSAETFPIARKQYAFLEMFEAIIISGEVGLIKPDPRIFELTLQRVGRAASECLLIDDSATNIEAAGSLGFATLRFQSPGQLRVELKQMHILD